MKPSQNCTSTDNGITRNEYDPLELEKILKEKSIETLQALQSILSTKSSLNDEEEKQEEVLAFQDSHLSDFFAYRKKTTSISAGDNIFLEVLIKVLNDKTSQFPKETNASEATDDDDEYNPTQDPQLQYQHLQQLAQANDRSNHISWKQGHSANQNNNNPTMNLHKFSLWSQQQAIITLIHELQTMSQGQRNQIAQLQLPAPSHIIPFLNHKLKVIDRLLSETDYTQLTNQNTAMIPVNGSTLSCSRATKNKCNVPSKHVLTIHGFMKNDCGLPLPQEITDLVLFYYTKMTFEAKFNNKAKGNFFISKQMIQRMVYDAYEEFNTDIMNDEKLAFGYFKESVAMSINDKQIHDIFQTSDGEFMIIINIDLSFKGGQVMYLIAMENDLEYREKVRWCIADFMSAQQILYKYGINNQDLPKSSRSMGWFRDGMNREPVNLSRDQIDCILNTTNFKALPKKTSKRKGKAKNEHKSRIHQQDLEYYVEQSLLNDNTPILPVVVIKGNEQWIEWKRFVEIYVDDESRQYIGISLRFHQGDKQWEIQCLDCDAGRCYYQHRLTSLPNNDHRNCSYKIISQYITTTLDIYDYRG